MTKVFVAVVTYNGKQWYDKCFSSLRNSTIPINIVVFDNSSTDDTVEYIQKYYSEIFIIESELNIGFGQGNNKIISYAYRNGADYVFLLNQDAWVEPNTIIGLINAHKNNREYGVLSPIHLNAGKTAIEKGQIVYLSTTRHTPNELISDFYLGIKKEVYDTNYVNAAAWLLPRKTIETVGGFDPLFFHYAEDDNYLSRVIYHGLKIGIVPRVTICHDTENRVTGSLLSAMSFEKWLLQRSTDLQFEDNHIEEMIKEYKRKTILKMLTLNGATFKENLKNVLFLIRNKKKIIYSREMNKQVGKTWLD